MNEAFERTKLLIHSEGLERLKNARVAVFGIGGVGGYVVEALARSGVGALELIDDDRVSLSNLNRQIVALRSTVGRFKVEVAAERIREINPDCAVSVRRTFYLPETAGSFDFTKYDYIVDAIDTVTGKLMLIQEADRCGTPIISCMGTGNKLHPELLELADISRTSICPLARIMRKELRKRGIRHLKVVYSKEPARTPADAGPEGIEPPDPETEEGRTGVSSRRSIPGSMIFVPAAAGLIIAAEVVRTLSGAEKPVEE